MGGILALKNNDIWCPQKYMARNIRNSILHVPCVGGTSIPKTSSQEATWAISVIPWEARSALNDNRKLRWTVKEPSVHRVHTTKCRLLNFPARWQIPVRLFLLSMISVPTFLLTRVQTLYPLINFCGLKLIYVKASRHARQLQLYSISSQVHHSSNCFRLQCSIRQGGCDGQGV
jgi:hypothetical protein